MSPDTRKQLDLEFYDIIPLPTVEMNGLAIKYVVTNAGTLGYIVTTLDHIGFTVAGQADILWWPLERITEILSDFASTGKVWGIRIWHRDIEDQNCYSMSLESYDKLKQAWMSHF
jgi:hypothetical protein